MQGKGAQYRLFFLVVGAKLIYLHLFTAFLSGRRSCRSHQSPSCKAVLWRLCVVTLSCLCEELFIYEFTVMVTIYSFLIAALWLHAQEVHQLEAAATTKKHAVLPPSLWINPSWFEILPSNCWKKTCNLLYYSMSYYPDGFFSNL